MTSRILLALLALTGGLLLGALLPLGFAMAAQHDRDYRSGTLTIAHTLAAAAEERLSDDANSPVLPHTLAALRHEDADGRDLVVAVVDRHGHVIVGGNTGLYRPDRASAALAGHTTITRTNGRLLATTPIVGDDESVAGALLVSRSLAPLEHRDTMLWARLAMVAVAAVIAAVVLAVALARWVGAPLRRLELTAEALGGGDLAARADPPRRPAEMRRLTERFNVMAARLETLVHDHRTVLADVSHQLRTPLAALRLRMELLAEEAATGDGGVDPADIDDALEELARLGRLVDGLLSVARAENSDAIPEPVDVAGLLRERAEAWRPVAGERGIRLTVEAHGGIVALARGGHLEQVIDNLVDNALTAAPSGGHVRLAARRVDHRVQVTVSDDGDGMSREAMAEAFRRFHSGRVDGTGLGLAIVHRLVTADGGAVRLADAPEGGLGVTLDLPVRR